MQFVKWDHQRAVKPAVPILTRGSGMRGPLQNSKFKSHRHRAVQHFVYMSICGLEQKPTPTYVLSDFQGSSWEAGVFDSKMGR